jgi:hypothetical protein
MFSIEPEADPGSPVEYYLTTYIAYDEIVERFRFFKDEPCAPAPS